MSPLHESLDGWLKHTFGGAELPAAERALLTRAFVAGSFTILNGLAANAKLDIAGQRRTVSDVRWQAERLRSGVAP